MVIKNNTKRIRIVVSYLLQKVTAAGLLISIFAVIILTSTMELYEFSESISSWFLWVMIFGYGILSSMVIDLLTYKIPFSNVFIEVLLYLIAGFLPFIFIMESPYIIFSGLIGAFSALLFLAGHFFIKRRVTKALFAFVIPFTLLVIAAIDFTSKENWKEEIGPSSYSASFDYFNGKHPIPIKAKSGDNIIFSVDFISKNGGGYGYRFFSENRDYLGMEELADNKLKATIKEDGIYYIEVRGDNLQGKLTVDWEIK